MLSRSNAGFLFSYICNLRLTVIILYLVCFGCYVLFTRQPDYFDSGRAAGTIIQKNNTLVAQFSDGRDIQYAEVPYGFLHKKGERVEVIYEIADSSNAKQYGILGYWITFGELIVSLLIIIVLYFIAVSITSNPTPEALIEEMEMRKIKSKKPKYDN